MNATPSASSNMHNGLAAFQEYWFTIWMTGNVVCESAAALVGPVIALSTIVIMCMTKEGVAKSSRVYYVALAIADLIALMGFHFFVFFLDDDLRYLSANTVYVAIESNNPLCKYMQASIYFAEHADNWLYVVLCAERLVAVKFPIKARTLFSQCNATKVVLVIVVMAFPTACLSAIATGSVSYPSLGVTYCMMLPIPHLAFTYSMYNAITVYIVPTTLTVCASVVLTMAVTAGAREQRHLLQHVPQQRDAGLRGSLTVLIMAFAHCTIYLPMEILSVWFRFLLLHNTDPYVSVSVMYSYWLFVNISAFTHCQNLFIYIWRMQAVRKVAFCQR
jgi:hypothetical protein